MKKLTILGFIALMSFAWKPNPVIEDIRKFYDLGNGLQCSTRIEIEVPGMSIPEKNVLIEMKPNEKPKVKGSGLIFLPRKGLANQFDELLNREVHVIPMGVNGDTNLYKLVAIDPESDWVTADLHVLSTLNRIEKMTIQSKENGEYTVLHSYGKHHFPIKSVVQFKIDEFKLPMQMMTRAKKSEPQPEGPITGTITLFYSDYVFL